MIYGILSLVAGLIIICNPKALVSIIPIILGIWIVINSAIKVQYSFYMKMDGNNRWKVTLTMSLITLICGIILLFNPFKTAEIVSQVIGLFIIIYAIIDLIESFMMKDKIKIKNTDV